MTVYTPGENDNQLFRDTDYTVADLTELAFSGQIPSRFITVFPDGGMEVSGAIAIVMKRFPKKNFVEEGVNPLAGILTALHRLAEIEDVSPDDDWKRNAGPVPVEGSHELVEMTYYNAEELGAYFEVKPKKVRRLLHWVLTQNPDLDPWIINDPKEGYMVAYPFLREFLKRNEDFGQFLKGLVTGRIRIVIDEEAE